MHFEWRRGGETTGSPRHADTSAVGASEARLGREGYVGRA